MSLLYDIYDQTTVYLSFLWLMDFCIAFIVGLSWTVLLLNIEPGACVHEFL
jgi:uncharacterized membrane protein